MDQVGLEIYPCREEDDGSGSSQLEGPGSVVGGLWEHLPEELVESLLLLMPLESQVRLRSVSKQWLDLLSPPRFTRKSASLRPLPLCCIKLSIRHQSVACRGSGCFLDLSYLPPEFRTAETADLVLVQDGLILLSDKSRDVSDAQYCVTNPLDTKAWRQLPPFRSERGPIYSVKMEVAPDRSSFLVFLQVLDESMVPSFEFSLVVYSSITDSWQPSSRSWRGCGAWLVTQGILYLHDLGDDSLCLVSMADGQILKRAHIGTFKTLRSYNLLGYYGAAYVASEARIWKLDGTTWELVAEMPTSLLTVANQAHDNDWKHIYRDGIREGDHICLCFSFRERWQNENEKIK